MADHRTTTGCWTCRLRKKKCDEGLPGCDRCVSHGLICHGYGIKPDWMDKGEKEKAERHNVKSIVRYHASLKRVAKSRAINQSRSNSDQHENLNRPGLDQLAISSVPITLLASAPTASLDARRNESHHHATAMPPTALENRRDCTPSSESATSCASPLMPAGSRDGSFSSLGPLISSTKTEFAQKDYLGRPIQPHQPPTDATELELNGALFPSALSDREASLLMHYFDRVFPLQYRFYSPSEAENGRGWLLALLTRTKPLYHAALSLSALHLQVLQQIRESESQTGVKSEITELYEHHEVALHELSRFIQLAEEYDDVKRKVQILACIVQFISFELFKGGTYNWQLHLQAATSISSGLITHLLPRDGFVSPVTLDTTGTAITFMCGVVLWMDTLSTITTEKRSLLYNHQEKILTMTQMDTITGCRNWVITSINEISNLAERKSEATTNSQEMLRVSNCAQQLRHEIEVRLKETEAEGASITGNQTSRSAAESTRHLACVRTRAYAAAAIIYLEVIICDGRPTSPDIQSAVQQSITSMKEIPEPEMIRGFMWPLVIAGCMAKREERAFFENMILSSGKAGMVLGNSSQSLAILKKCWELQEIKQEDSDNYPDWRRAMKDLGSHVLLV